MDRLIARLGIDQHKLAEVAGLMDGSISAYRHKDAAPGLDVFERVIKNLKLAEGPQTLWWLASGENPPSWLDDPNADPYTSSPPGPSTPPGGTKIAQAIRNATTTVLSSAPWAAAIIRMAKLAQQTADPSEVESIREEIVQLLDERGRSSVGRAAAFYGVGRSEPVASPFVEPSTTATRAKSRPNLRKTG